MKIAPFYRIYNWALLSVQPFKIHFQQFLRFWLLKNTGLEVLAFLLGNNSSARITISKANDHKLLTSLDDSNVQGSYEPAKRPDLKFHLWIIQE